MRNIEFHTKKYEFILTERALFKNGEVIAEGDIVVHQLMLGLPASIEIVYNDYCPPLFIETERIRSILPSNEFFEDQRITQKSVFKVNFSVCKKGKWVERSHSILAINAKKAYQIVQYSLPEQNIQMNSVSRDVAMSTA